MDGGAPTATGGGALTLDRLPVAALVLAGDGVVTEANSRAEVLLDHPGGALVGLHLADLVHADHGDRLRALLDDLTAHGAPATAVLRRRPDPPTWIGVDAICADGRILVLLRDATEEVRTFRILRESAWTATIASQEGVRLWGPVGREHPEDRPSQIAGSAVDRVHPEDIATVLDAFARVTAEEGRRERVDARLRDISRDDAWAKGTVEMFNARAIPEIAGILLRVHDRAASEAVESIARTGSSFLSVAEAAPVGIILTGPAGYPAYLNEAIRTMLPGVGTGEAERDWTTRVHPDERDDLRAWLADALGAVAPSSRTVRFAPGDDRPLWLLVTVAPRRVADEAVVGHVITLQDVTAEVLTRHELEEAQQHLRHLASHDPLTGLANRTLLDEAVESLGSAVRGGRDRGSADDRVGVLFCDLDGFKAINDTLGHAAGDRVLVEVASRLRAVCRSSDLVARVGGDEFLVLAATDADELGALAERIATAVAEPIDLDGRTVSVGVSVGAATLDGDESIDALLKRADAAMYERKLASRPATGS